MLKKTDWKIAFKVCGDSLRRWKKDPRIWAAMTLVCLFEWTKIEPVRQFCAEQGMAISNWFYPFLFSETINTMFFFFGIILLFCDAPFVDRHQLFVVMRTGKRKWFLGKIVYVFVASFAYFTWMYMVSIIEFIPYVGVSANWERILEGLSITNKIGNTIVNVPRNIIIQMSPVHAFLISFSLSVMIGSFLGLLIFYANLYRTHNIGVSISLIIVLMPGVVNVLPYEIMKKIQWISPVNWIAINIFTLEYGGISVGYAYTFLIVIDIILIILIMRKAEDYNMEAMEEL